jgi:hypothetical protein
MFNFTEFFSEERLIEYVFLFYSICIAYDLCPILRHTWFRAGKYLLMFNTSRLEHVNRKHYCLSCWHMTKICAQGQVCFVFAWGSRSGIWFLLWKTHYWQTLSSSSTMNWEKFTPMKKVWYMTLTAHLMIFPWCHISQP